MEKVLAVSVPLSAIFILRNVKIGLDLFYTVNMNRRRYDEKWRAPDAFPEHQKATVPHNPEEGWLRPVPATRKAKQTSCLLGFSFREKIGLNGFYLVFCEGNLSACLCQK